MSRTNIRTSETWPLFGPSVWLYGRDCRAREREADSLSLGVDFTTNTLGLGDLLATEAISVVLEAKLRGRLDRVGPFDMSFNPCNCRSMSNPSVSD